MLHADKFSEFLKPCDCSHLFLKQLLTFNFFTRITFSPEYQRLLLYQSFGERFSLHPISAFWRLLTDSRGRQGSRMPPPKIFYESLVSKCDKIRKKMWICSYLPKKFFMQKNSSFFLQCNLYHIPFLFNSCDTIFT